MQGKDNEKFSFINEKRKEKPLNKKKLLAQLAYAVCLAVIFGLAASFVFAFFEPRFSQLFYPEQGPVVTIPKDETEMPQQEPQTETETETEAETETETESEAIGRLPDEGITLPDFQKLQNELYAVGREANKFIVTVTGVKSDTDWFNNSYESKGQASGVIIADNGQELLILTERKAITGAQEMFVTFINDVTAPATMKKYDGNTGIAVLSVPRESVNDETLHAITVAELGNSLVATQGMMVIAVGSPLGTNYSILTGNITSTTNSISTIDRNYTVFTTDIVGSSQGSGVLINTSGQVIGLVMQAYGNDSGQNTLTAISVSELKSLIEMLSNNEEIPYIGLELTTVTNDIATEYEIPKGAYIKEVRIDSPAMAAGLQKGDVVTKMQGETIFNVDSYENKLLDLQPGSQVELVVQRQGQGGYKEVTCTVEVSVYSKQEASGRILLLEMENYMKYIESLREGERLNEIYLCKVKQSAMTKAGKPYDNLILQDKTGTLDAKIWDPGSVGIEEFDSLDYIAVMGDVTNFQGNLQLNVKRVRKVGGGEYDREGY